MSTYKVTKYSPQNKLDLIMSPTSLTTCGLLSTTQGSSLQNKVCAPGGEQDEPLRTEVKCQNP